LSKLGGVIAFSAEAGIWIAGAALIASAAGMHWSVDLPAVNLDALTGAKSSASTSGSPSASLHIKPPTPSASPAGSTPR
jgi:4-hydroxybenzoate polyprenyltransferase